MMTFLRDTDVYYGEYAKSINTVDDNVCVTLPFL